MNSNSFIRNAVLDILKVATRTIRGPYESRNVSLKYIPYWLKEELTPEDQRILGWAKRWDYWQDYKHRHNVRSETDHKVNVVFRELRRIQKDLESTVDLLDLDDETGMFRAPGGKVMDASDYDELKKRLRFLRMVTGNYDTVKWDKKYQDISDALSSKIEHRIENI